MTIRMIISEPSTFNVQNNNARACSPKGINVSSRGRSPRLATPKDRSTLKGLNKAQFCSRHVQSVQALRACTDYRSDTPGFARGYSHSRPSA